MPVKSMNTSFEKRFSAQTALFAGVLLFFFISGACGLLYQVVWTRKLVLLFGTTSYAVSTVLSIFFLGLGLGSLWGGRLADRRGRPLFLYGIFEVIVGLWALLFILVVESGEGVVVAILRALDVGRGGGIALRAVLALGLLFVPVFLMGATLPLLAKFVTREAVVRGLRVGGLYTANTFGAVVGCFLTGFVLIEALGYTRTTLVGAALNVGVGMVALVVSRRMECNWEGRPASGDIPLNPPSKGDFSGVPAGVEENKPLALNQPALEGLRLPGEVPVSALQLRLVLVAFALSGFCALALEVLWTRLLTIVFLGTTYAYTTMLTTLLCGLALGGAVGSLTVDRIRYRVHVLAGILMLTCYACLFSSYYIAGLPERLLALQQSSGNNWADVTRGSFYLAFVALLPPTFFFGMTFPFVVKIVGRERATLGNALGKLYSANTFGGVLGAAAAGYVLIPLLGTDHSIRWIAFVLGLTALLLLWAGRKDRLSMPLAAGFMILLMGMAWTGKYIPDVNAALNVGYIPKDHQVVTSHEGTEGTVVVSEPVGVTDGRDRVLWINRVQATTSIVKGVRMNRLQGVLPLLFDRDPKEVLFMCFGSGITCGTLALSDLHIDAVEISPDVLKAAPLFAVDNLGVIDRPNVNFHIDDGRNFLLTTRNQYDIITFEPMPLALAGVSTFYTQDYYKLCLERLKPGGLVSQWVPLHSLSPEVVRSLVYTFTTVFPHYCAFFVNADLFLMGSNDLLRLDYDKAAARLAQPELAAALAKVGYHDVAEVFATFLLNQEGVDRFARGGTVMTDDRPWAEFVAPKLVYQRKVVETVTALQEHVGSPVPLMQAGASPEALAAVALRHQAYVSDLEALKQYYGGLGIGPEVVNGFLASLRIDPQDGNAKFYIRDLMRVQAENLLRWEEYDELEQLLLSVLQVMPGDAEMEGYLAQTHAAREAAAATPAQ